MIINGEGAILGRLSSVIAKQLLMGNEIIVVNADKIVVSGDSKVIENRFLEKIHRGGPFKGPFYPKQPDKLFIRVVRGMLPKNDRGRTALKRLKAYRDCPEDFKNLEIIGKRAEELNAKYMTLEDICRK